MVGCLILGDAAVHELLINLPKPDILLFQQKLQQSLQGYSTTERQYQPNAGVSVRPNGQKSLFRPFTSPSSVGCKIIVDPAPDAHTGKKSPLHGVLVVCDANGSPAAVINAEEVTGFRTSLCALIPWMWRRRTDKIVVFGTGKQALWHVRLMLALRGDEVRSVTLVGRTRERAQALIEQIRKENDSRWQSKASLDCVTSVSGDDDAKVLQDLLSTADAIFCTVPSRTPLFSLQALQRSSSAEQSQSLYISAIGSWQPDMIELDPALLQHLVSADDAYVPMNDGKTAAGGKGVILVDDRESVAEHTGEILQSGLGRMQLVELGEILEMREKSQEKEDGSKETMEKWLRDGRVVYKSVGVGLTDLASGEAILELARRKGGVGTLVCDL